MGCECEKPEDRNDEVRADENEVHDLESKDEDLLGNNNDNDNGKPNDSFSRYLFEQKMH